MPRPTGLRGPSWPALRRARRPMYLEDWKAPDAGDSSEPAACAGLPRRRARDHCREFVVAFVLSVWSENAKFRPWFLRVEARLPDLWSTGRKPKEPEDLKVVFVTVRGR